MTAQMYDERYREEQETKYKAALNGLNLTSDTSVLDVGCGSGMFFGQVAGKVKVVVGLDISRELLLLAKERAGKFGNVGLIQADVDHLPFKKGVFAYVFAFTVLQNMPSPLETLRELQVSASSDAYFVVTGLKAATPLEKFGMVLKKAGLRVISLCDDEALRCYVVVAVRVPN